MKEKNYKLLKKLVSLLFTTVAVATVLTACNGDNGQTSKPSDQKPPIEQTEVTVAQILADIQEYNEFDIVNSFNGVAAEIVKKNIEDSQATLLKYTVADHNFVVVAENKNGSFTSVALPILEECENYIKNNTSKQTLVLNVAGLSVSDMIKENEKDAAVKKITDAIEKIESNVAKIDDAEPSQTNNYIAEGDKVDLDGLFAEDRSAAYLREDGSVIAFVFDEEKCEIAMKHYVVDGAKDMTAAQIVSAILNGSSVETSTQLKFDEDLQLPPLNQEVAETITVGEIFDQNFADISFDADMEAAFQKLYMTGFSSSNSETLFYNLDKEKNELRIFFDLNRQGAHDFAEIYMPTPQILKNLEHGVRAFVSSELGLGMATEVELSKKDEIKAEINEIVANIQSEILKMGNLGVREIKTRGYGAASSSISNAFDYAQKLFPGKEIVAAYVGDMSHRSIDSQGRFNTGYFCTFDIAVAYKVGDDIKVNEVNCMVPWYTNSTTETLYNSLLNGTEGQTYKLQNSQTTVVSNPIIVKSKEA